MFARQLRFVAGHFKATSQLNQLLKLSTVSTDSHNSGSTEASPSESEVADADFFSTPLESFPQHLTKLPHWIKLPPPELIEATSSNVMDNVKASGSAFKKKYTPEKLQEIFDQKIKPFLLSRGLLCVEKMGTSWFLELHFMNKDTLGRFPDYVTSKTLMDVLVTRSEDQWRPILESLAADRVTVLLDWISTYPPIQIDYYSHGQLLAPQSDAQCDSDVYKAECDASFIKTSEAGGDAAIAFAIWKNARLMAIQAMRDLNCNSSQQAEAISLLSALNRGTDFGIKKLLVITDNEENFETMMGSRNVFDSNHPDTSIAFIEAAKKYDICKCQKEPREMLSHINDLAKEALKADPSDPFDLGEIFEKSSPLFWGLPRVIVKQNPKKIIVNMGKWDVDRHRDIKYPESYYVDVHGNEGKAAALEGLLASLDPKVVVVLVNSYESAVKVTRELGHSCSVATWNSGRKIDQTTASENCQGSALIVINQNVIPPLPDKECLLVVYDNPSEPIQYSHGQDTSYVMPVYLVTPQEKHVLPQTAEMIDPFIFGFFHLPDATEGAGPPKRRSANSSKTRERGRPKSMPSPNLAVTRGTGTQTRPGANSLSTRGRALGHK